jgi:hypothetical protein
MKMKKYLVASLVAVMALSAVAPALASKEGENENRGRETSELRKQEDRQEDRREDRQEDRRNDDQKKKDLEKSLRYAPRAITFVGKLATASTVSEFTSTTTSTTITVNVVNVMPKKSSKIVDPAVVYPVVGNNLVLTLTKKTTFVREFFGKMKLSDMSVGDELRIVAKFNKDGSLSVTAVKDNSIHMISSKKGEVVSLDAVNKTFVFKQGDKTLTVKTDADTKFVSRINNANSTIAFADLKVGSTVRVVGIVNTNLNTVIKTKLVTVKAPAPTSTPSI